MSAAGEEGWNYRYVAIILLIIPRRRRSPSSSLSRVFITDEIFNSLIDVDYYQNLILYLYDFFFLRLLFRPIPSFLT